MNRGARAEHYADLCRWVVVHHGGIRKPYAPGRNGAKRARRERARSQRATELRLRKASRKNVKRWAKRCKLEPELILEGP